MILRNIHYISMWGIHNGGSNETRDYLLSCYNSNSPKFFDKIACIVIKNEGQPKKISKIISLSNIFLFMWKLWDVTDSLSDIKDKHLPVILFSTFYIISIPKELNEQIKDLNVIGFEATIYPYKIWTNQIKDILLSIIESKNPMAFVKINNYILRNFTKNKTSFLKELLKTNMTICIFWKSLKQEFMNYIEIKGYYDNEPKYIKLS